jgi:vacuolar protein sorting-associated protein IST1
MAISKLKFIQDKKTALAKQQRRQLADLLNQSKELSAKIRVENIIRDDIYVELLEYLELYCELLLARMGMITDINRPTCDSSLAEAVQSVIYSAQYTELKEMTSLKEVLIHKYGIEFGKIAMENTDGVVPEKIVRRCEVEVPSETLVNLYLCEIARAYEAPYSGLAEYELTQAEEDEAQDKDNDEDDNNNGSGGQKVKVLQEAISVSTEECGNSAKSGKDDFDALKARFAALKRG